MFGFMIGYIDPAFAGLLVQIILAVLVVGGAMVFAMKRKAKSLFSKKQDNDTVVVPIDNTISEDGVVDTLAD